ncbi:MAG: hypothetical protein ACR2JE_04735 [Acidobacteriaceae bacterium]
MRQPIAAILLTLTLLPISAGRAQIGSNPPVPPSWNRDRFPGQNPTPNTHDSQPTETAEEKMERQTSARMNDKRLQQAVTDAHKLLQLATELKDEVDKTNQGVVSVDTSKKADEIIKLAKSVKDKIRPL